MLQQTLHVKSAAHKQTYCCHGNYLRSLLWPDGEILNTRGQLIKALTILDPTQDALREESTLAALVAQKEDVQSLKQQSSTSDHSNATSTNAPAPKQVKHAVVKQFLFLLLHSSHLLKIYIADTVKGSRHNCTI